MILVFVAMVASLKNAVVRMHNKAKPCHHWVLKVGGTLKAFFKDAFKGALNLKSLAEK